MNQCGTCKYWGENREKGQDFRSCQAIKHDAHYYSEREEQDLWEDDEIKTTCEFKANHRAVVVDRSGCFAALRSRSDFGCVLYEPSNEDVANANAESYLEQADPRSDRSDSSSHPGYR